MTLSFLSHVYQNRFSTVMLKLFVFYSFQKRKTENQSLQWLWKVTMIRIKFFFKPSAFGCPVDTGLASLYDFECKVCASKVKTDKFSHDTKSNGILSFVPTPCQKGVLSEIPNIFISNYVLSFAFIPFRNSIIVHDWLSYHLTLVRFRHSHVRHFPAVLAFNWSSLFPRGKSLLKIAYVIFVILKSHAFFL